MKPIFKIIAKLNKLILPKLWKRDLTKMSKLEKAMAAWKYWVTSNALDDNDVPYGRL